MKFGQISLANMTYIRSQNYTNIVVGKHRLQAFDVVVVMLLLMLLSFDVFVPKSAHLLLFLDKQFVHLCLNINDDNWLRHSRRKKN
jgi:hypothetical protein